MSIVLIIFQIIVFGAKIPHFDHITPKFISSERPWPLSLNPALQYRSVNYYKPRTKFYIYPFIGQSYVFKILAFHIVVKQIFAETLALIVLIHKNGLFFHFIHLHVIENCSGNCK